MNAFCQVLIGAWTLVFPSAVPLEVEFPTVIRSARVVASPGKVIENGSILVEDGRIVAVGAGIEIPADAEIVDLGDAVVYPGFIDANTHLGIPDSAGEDTARARTEGENPDVREGPQSATVEAHRRLIHPAWRAEELFDSGKAKMDEHRRAGFTAALVSPRPAIWSGSSAVLLLGDSPLRRGLLRTAAAQHAAFIRGARSDDHDGPPARSEYPTTTMGAMAAFRQAMLDARWHADLLAWSQRNPAQVRVPVDRDLEVLAGLQDSTQPVVFIANTENEIHRALDMAAEFRLRPVIAGGAEAWRAVERLKAQRVPVIVSLLWPENPGEAARKAARRLGKESNEPDANAPLFDAQWEAQPFEPGRLIEERQRLWEERVGNLRVLVESGVNVAVASFELESPGEVLERLREAVKLGLAEEDALAALTRSAANVLDSSGQIGEIAPGRLANLTVFDRPWTEGRAKVKSVFIEGRAYPIHESGRRRGGAARGGDADASSESADEPGKAAEAEEEPAAAAGNPAESAGKSAATAPPAFACELEADRKPSFQTGGNLLIRNATLLTCAEAGDLERTDLLVRDGRIAAIGQGLSDPGGVLTIDAAGFFVMPGIIDAHSHMCSDGGLNESSLSVTCEVRVRDVIDHRDVGAFRALAGGVTTIHTMHGSANTIGGQNAVLQLKYGRPACEWLMADAPRTVKFALGENVKQSNFGTKGTRFPNSRMGVEAVMRRSFDAARRYQQDWVRFENERLAGLDPRPLRRDLRLEALVDILEGRLWVHTHCYRADEILRLLDVAESYGFRVAVLQHVLEGYRVIPEMLRHGCAASTFSDWWGYKLEAFNAIPYNAARMLQSGVVTTVNSDSAEMIRHLYLEAAKSLRYGGLSPREALHMITIHAAAQLGIDERVGSLEAGKQADIAIFDGHPLDTLSRCMLTVIAGEVYFQHPAFDIRPPRPQRAAMSFPAPAAPLKLPADQAGVYCLVGGTVHPVSAAVIERGTVVIDSGRLAYVGSGADYAPPADAQVIDISGLHVFPGLINAGTSLGLTEIGSVAGSVDVSDIGSIQPDLLALSAYDPFSSAIEVTRAEGVLTAVVLAGRQAVAGRAGIVRLAGWSMPEAALALDAALCVNLPSLPVESPRRMSKDEQERRNKRREEHARTMADIEQFFRSAAHYARVGRPGAQPAGGAQASSAGAGAAAAAEAIDRRLEAMRPYITGARPVVMQADSYKQILEALAFAKRYGLRPIIYGGREAWKLAERLAAERIDVILTGAMEYPAGEYEPWDSVYRCAAELDRAGVRFCFATGGATLAKLLGVEAGMAAAHGLPADKALQAMTLNAAEILGLDRDLGSLEPGKRGTIFVATASPLQASSRVVAAFIDGVPLDLSSKHSRLDAQFLARPAAVLPGRVELAGPGAMRLEGSTPRDVAGGPAPAPPAPHKTAPAQPVAAPALEQR